MLPMAWRESKTGSSGWSLGDRLEGGALRPEQPNLRRGGPGGLPLLKLRAGMVPPGNPKPGMGHTDTKLPQTLLTPESPTPNSRHRFRVLIPGFSAI